MKIGKKNKDDKKNKAGQKDDGGTGETKDGAKKKDRVWDKNKGGKLGTPLKNKHSSSAATPGKNGKAKPGTEATPGMGKVARDSSATSSASPLVRPRKPAIRFSKGWLKRKKKTWKKIIKQRRRERKNGVVWKPKPKPSRQDGGPGGEDAAAVRGKQGRASALASKGAVRALLHRRHSRRSTPLPAACSSLRGEHKPPCWWDADGRGFAFVGQAEGRPREIERACSSPSC